MTVFLMTMVLHFAMLTGATLRHNTDKPPAKGEAAGRLFLCLFRLGIATWALVLLVWPQ